MKFNKRNQLQKLRGVQFVIINFFIASLMIFSAGAAGVAQTATQPTATAQAANPNIAAANVTEFDVNGLKVLVKRRAGSQSVAAGLFLRGGARNITAANAGIESLMLAAATEASANYPRQRMRTELARLSTGIGFNVELDYSALTFNSTRANFDRSWEIFTDVALRPSFNAEDVRLMQQRIVSSLSDEASTPDAYLQLLQDRASYAGHPYLNRPQGTVETVSRLNVEDLRAHHKQAMQTSRLLLILVGDLDAKSIETRVAQTFGKLPRGDYKPQPVTALSFTAPSIEIVARELPTNYVQGVFTAPNPTSPDFYAMRVASVILRDRIFREVRERRNLSYAPSAFLATQGANVGGIYVSAVDANQAVRVMLDEITSLQNEAVDEREIAGVTGLFLTTHYLGQETNAAQVGELATYEIIGGGWRNSTDFLQRVRAVTPADVRRVARQYMRNMRFVVVGNPSRIDKQIFTATSLEGTTAAPTTTTGASTLQLLRP